MAYPWYCLVNSDELEQGDILEHCPVFAPPLNLILLKTRKQILRGRIAMLLSCLKVVI